MMVRFRFRLRAVILALVASVVAASNAKGLAFLEEKKNEDGVVVLDSGLQYKVIRKGTGKAHPLVGTSCGEWEKCFRHT